MLRRFIRILIALTDNRKGVGYFSGMISEMLMHLCLHCFVFWKAPVKGMLIYICEAAASVLVVLAFRKLGIRVRR